GVDHPVCPVHDLPAAHNLYCGYIVGVDRQAILRQPRRIDSGDVIARDAQSRPGGVVAEALLGSNVPRIGRRLQPIISVRNSVAHYVRTRQPGAVHVGPARRDALVGIAVAESLTSRRGTDLLYVDGAEGLLVADGRELTRTIEQQKLIEVLQVIVPVGA